MKLTQLIPRGLIERDISDIFNVCLEKIKWITFFTFKDLMYAVCFSHPSSRDHFQKNTSSFDTYSDIANSDIFIEFPETKKWTFVEVNNFVFSLYGRSFNTFKILMDSLEWDGRQNFQWNNRIQIDLVKFWYLNNQTIV
jgi:hypothetical protein